MDNVFKEGDKIQVKLIEVDSKTGKLKLSRKALLPKPDKKDGGGRPERKPAENQA